MEKTYVVNIFARTYVRQALKIQELDPSPERDREIHYLHWTAYMLRELKLAKDLVNLELVDFKALGNLYFDPDMDFRAALPEFISSWSDSADTAENRTYLCHDLSPSLYGIEDYL